MITYTKNVLIDNNTKDMYNKWNIIYVRNTYDKFVRINRKTF